MNALKTLQESCECQAGCRPLLIPTDEEVKALDALRSIKVRVREIKQKLKGLGAHEPGITDDKRDQFEQRLERLRAEWRVWEKRREEAARMRMVLLGHI
jgi:hypothetical protein